MRAGDRSEVVEFLSPQTNDDGYGGVLASWSPAFQREAGVRYLRGGETVQAARLEGRQPAVFTVPVDSQTETVRPSWRLTDLRTGRQFNIKTIILTENHQDYELTCESTAA